jgi:hypothetical protein
MTGTDLCVNKPHKSRSYLNHLVFWKNGKSSRGWGGGIVGCHVTSPQGKPVDFEVSVRVATKW